MSRASQMLAEASTIQKAKELKDLALTAADWARRKGLGEEAVQHARFYAIQAERRMGEMLAETERNKGAKGSKVTGNKRVPVIDETPTLSDLGITKRESSQAQQLAALPDDEFKAVVDGKQTRSNARKAVTKNRREAALQTAQKKVTLAVRSGLAGVCDIRRCSMQELLGDPSVRPDCIITDPPYPEKFLPLYGELGRLAARIPVVAVMCGQSYLPSIIAALCEHLSYRWTLAYLTPGGQAVQQWPCKINTFWKPVLLFGEAREWIGDVCRSETNDNDKRFHEWGQSESGMAQLIERISLPEQLVCDPFLGGATTAVVSLRLGRRFVGCDISGKAIDESTRRCETAFAE